MNDKVIDIQGEINIVEADGCGDYIVVGNWTTKQYRLVEYLIYDLKLLGKVITVRYWITSEEKTKEEATEQHLKQVMGCVEGEWHSIYSDVTGYLVLGENLVVGGHDLVEELRSHKDKYLILEVTVHEGMVIKTAYIESDAQLVEIHMRKST